MPFDHHKTVYTVIMDVDHLFIQCYSLKDNSFVAQYGTYKVREQKFVGNACDCSKVIKQTPGPDNVAGIV